MERATCASGSNGTHDALHRSSYNSDAGNLVRQRGSVECKKTNNKWAQSVAVVCNASQKATTSLAVQHATTGLLQRCRQHARNARSQYGEYVQ